MKPEEVEKVANLMESTWSNSFYKKDHKSLTGSLMIMMSDCECKAVIDIIKDYAFNYDNVPTLATLAKLAHKSQKSKEEKKDTYISPKYFEDEDGYGYMLNAEHEYECIWKPNWLKRGITKMETLKKHGLVNY